MGDAGEVVIVVLFHTMVRRREIFALRLKAAPLLKFKGPKGVIQVGGKQYVAAIGRSSPPA